jgi:hypothetical protein
MHVTKVPALDTIDHYVINKSGDNSIARSPSVDLFCSSDIKDITDDIVQGYARYISNFTGLEDVAFLVSRHSDLASGTAQARSVICASVVCADGDQPQKDRTSCKVRELDARYYNKDEVQFSLTLGFGVGPENGELQPSVQESVSFRKDNSMLGAIANQLAGFCIACHAYHEQGRTAN